ncbi:unnamed protein product [Phaeothamnion confervicola]
MPRLGALMVVAAACAGGADAYSFLAGGALIAPRSVAPGTSSLRMAGYVPDGVSPEEWKRIQEQEKKERANLGKLGVTRFKSRSFQAWHEAGGQHLFPVDPQKVKKGEIPLEKVPYMQRGGAWDDSDLAGTKPKPKAAGIIGGKVVRKAWSATDKAYANGGEAAQQSANIFGRGAALPWNARFVPISKSAFDPRKVQEQVSGVDERENGWRKWRCGEEREGGEKVHLMFMGMLSHPRVHFSLGPANSGLYRSARISHCRSHSMAGARGFSRLQAAVAGVVVPGPLRGRRRAHIRNPKIVRLRITAVTCY